MLTTGIFSVVLVTSCKNKCGSTTCQNGGACTDNLCVCPIGFSGNACQTGWTDIFVATYKCQRYNCTPAVTGDTTYWQSAITKDATNPGYTIDISNFDNSNTTVAATVDSNINGVSNIEVSTVTGTYGINATGTYSNDTIRLKFTTSSVGGVGGYTCQMVLGKE